MNRFESTSPEPARELRPVREADPERRTLTRRSFLRTLVIAAAAVPLGAQASAQFGPRVIRAQDAEEPVDAEEAEEVVEAAPARPEPIAPGVHAYSLRSRDEGPLEVGRTINKYKAEIGFSTFDDGAYVMHLHEWRRGLNGQDWMNRRIGQFSLRDGAVMVEALGELNPIGCFAIEMRHQAYKDRRYIRANWLSIDPPTGNVMIGTDGIWNEMRPVAMVQGSPAVRPQGEWNTFLFMASGAHLEGWVNGEKVVEGTDRKWGSGRISLIAMRMDKSTFRTRFRNLRVWENQLPDPTTVW